MSPPYKSNSFGYNPYREGSPYKNDPYTEKLKEVQHHMVSGSAFCRAFRLGCDPDAFEITITDEPEEYNDQGISFDHDTELSTREREKRRKIITEVRNNPNDKPIDFRINSDGGSIEVLHDILDAIEGKELVRTFALGRTSSAASMLLFSGTPHNRFAALNNETHLHSVRFISENYELTLPLDHGSTSMNPQSSSVRHLQQDTEGIKLLYQRAATLPIPNRFVDAIVTAEGTDVSPTSLLSAGWVDALTDYKNALVVRIGDNKTEEAVKQLIKTNPLQQPVKYPRNF